MIESILVGTEYESKEALELPVDAFLKSHSWVMGSTGSGKSRFLRGLIDGLISLDFPLVVIDGKGDLVDDVAASCARDFDPLAENPLGPDRVVILDPSDTTFVPGFNPCALDGLDPFARATVVTRALAKVFGEDEELKPWLTEYARYALVPLAYEGLSLLDLEPFLRDTGFRDVIVQRCPDSRVRDFWGHVETLPAAEREARLSAARTRASLLFSSAEGVRRLLGSHVTFDFDRLIERNGILLVNASESAGVDQSAATLLGITVVQKLLERCAIRPAAERKPVFCVIDECQETASADVVRSLDKSRGWGLHFVLAHQGLYQLQQVEGLYESMCSNAQNRFWFRGSSKDYEELIDEAFTGFWPPRDVVQELTTVSPWPVQHWEDITTRSSTRSIAHHPEQRSVTSHPEVISIREAATRGRGGSQSHGFSASHGQDGFSRGVSSQHGSNQTRSYQEGRAIAPAHQVESVSAAYDIETEGESESTTPTLVTEYEPFEQVSSRQLETIADIKERVRAWLVNQDERTCFVKLGQLSRPTRLMVKWIPDHPVSAQTLALYRRLLLRGYPSKDQVDQLLYERPAALLSRYEHHYTSTELIDDDAPTAKAPATIPGTRY